MKHTISNNRGPTTFEAGNDFLARQDLIEEGYQEREYFWLKRNRYGSIQIPKDEKSDITTLTGGDQGTNNKNVKKEQKEDEVGRITILEYDRSKLFDEKGALILVGVKK